MYAEGDAVDSITVINALQARGILDEVGGKAVINTLASTVPSVSNARRYAEIVRETSTYRGLIKAGTQIADLGYQRLGDPQEAVDRAEQVVFEIANQRISSDFSPIKDLLNASLRADHPAAQERPRHHRRAQRFPRPRPDHRRLPAAPTC